MAHLHRTPSYTFRTPYSYVFRIRVPQTLQQYVGRTELRYSLKTGYKGVAKRKAQYLAGSVLLLFRMFRKYKRILDSMPEGTIQKLVEQHIRKELDLLEESLYVQPDEDLGETPFGSMEQLGENIEAGEELNNLHRLKFANGDFSFFEGMADGLLKSTSTDSIKKGSHEYNKLCGRLHEVDGGGPQKLDKVLSYMSDS